MELSEMPAAPVGTRVFVSYAHESDEHKAQVLAFATFLRSVGIMAALDLWSAVGRQDWYSWAIREMTDADFVLVVASERYRMIGDGSGPSTEHRGVQSEAAMLRELVYGDRVMWLPKILPVVLPGHTINQIPLFLQPHTASRFHVTSFDTTGAEELLRVILSQPGHLTPAVSTEQLVLPPHEEEPDRAARPSLAMRRPRLTSDLAQSLEEFALEVGLRLQDEHQPRQALGPKRLAVRWKQPDRMLSDHLANITDSKTVHLDLAGKFDEIAEFYRKVPSRRLVILGEQGSGKTTLAIQFVIDTLEHRKPEEPVPVIVNIGSWNPASTGLREWLSGQLIRDYPALAATGTGGTVAKTLVGTHHILPVLDGFDEITPGLQGLAISKLNRAGLPMGVGLPLVLTSRPDDYRRAVETGVLTAAAVVQLDTLTAEDLVAYLPLSARPGTDIDTDPRTSTAWTPVIARLEAPSSDAAATNIASALETPLMVWLARTIYSGTPDRDPAELLDTERFPDPDAIQKYLIECYVPTVYEDQGRTSDGPAWDPDQIRKWLRNLARHAQHPNTTDIAWWQIGTTMSLWTRSGIVALAASLVIGLVVGLTTLMEVTAPAGGLVAPSLFTTTLINAVVAGTLIGLAYGLARRHRNAAPGPSRIRFRGRRRAMTKPFAKLRPVVLIALLGGFVFGVGTAFQTGSWMRESGLVPSSVVFRTFISDIILFGAAWSVAIAAAVAIMTWLESPADLNSAATPETFLRLNRVTVLTQMLLGGLIVGLMVVFGMRPIGSFVYYLLQHLAPQLMEGIDLIWLPRHEIYIVANFLAAALGCAVAFAVVFAAWGHWLILVRFWLPLTGQLPWNLMTFLDDAHRRGVLRQQGPVYQFRHNLLQDHLANAR